MGKFSGDRYGRGYRDSESEIASGPRVGSMIAEEFFEMPLAVVGEGNVFVRRQAALGSSLFSTNERKPNPRPRQARRQ